MGDLDFLRLVEAPPKRVYIVFFEWCWLGGEGSVDIKKLARRTHPGGKK